MERAEAWVGELGTRVAAMMAVENSEREAVREAWVVMVAETA